MGDLYRDLGQGQLARDAFSQALAISQRLALAEPDRTDYQRDLAVSFQRMGDLCLDEHQPELAAREFQKSRDIWQRLSDAEPTRADLQRGLVIPLLRLSTLPRPDADTDLMQAWCLLSDLVASGRLNPSDQGLVNHVRSLMAQRGLPTG